MSDNKAISGDKSLPFIELANELDSLLKQMEDLRVHLIGDYSFTALKEFSSRFLEISEKIDSHYQVTDSPYYEQLVKSESTISSVKTVSMSSLQIAKYFEDCSKALKPYSRATARQLLGEFMNSIRSLRTVLSRTSLLSTEDIRLQRNKSQVKLFLRVTFSIAFLAGTSAWAFFITFYQPVGWLANHPKKIALYFCVNIMILATTWAIIDAKRRQIALGTILFSTFSLCCKYCNLSARELTIVLHRNASV